jgi:hypothetical protein
MFTPFFYARILVSADPDIFPQKLYFELNGIQNGRGRKQVHKIQQSQALVKISLHLSDICRKK